MFLFPTSPINDTIMQIFSPDKPKEHNFSLSHQEGADGHLRSLHVPFCLNLMAGGRYSTGRLATLTSISGREHFHVEKMDPTGGKSVPNEQTELHKHDFFELIYVLEGQVEQHIEEGCYLYEKGYACLMNRNTRHFEVLGESYFLVYLCLSKDYIRDAIRESGSLKGTNDVYCFFADNVEELAQYQKNYIEFTPAGKTGVRQADQILESIAQELLMGQPGSSYVVQGYVTRLFACLQNPDYYTHAKITLDSSAEGYLFQRITHFMEQQPGRTGRAELTASLNYSSDYLNRIVKKHSGMSISEYSQVICLKKAERLLLETDQGITHIISSLGFENKTHFYKLFDKKHGLTPLEYRKRYENAAN